MTDGELDEFISEAAERARKVGWVVLEISVVGFGVGLCRPDGMTAILSVTKEEDDHLWAHLSLARRDRLPSYGELMAAKELFLGDVEAYSCHVPKARHVNSHPNCLHLYHCLDSAEEGGRVLPRFERNVGGGVVI